VPKITQTARWGTAQTVSAAFKDGAVEFGGVPGKVCTVSVTGAARAGAAQAIRDGMGNFAQFGMKADPANSSQRPGAKIEAYAGKVDATTFLHLFITLMDAPYPTATSVALYVSDK
jgi:hypothetical protein